MGVIPIEVVGGVPRVKKQPAMVGDEPVVKAGMVCGDYHAVLTGQEFSTEGLGLPGHAVVHQMGHLWCRVGNLGPLVFKQSHDWEGGGLPHIGYIMLVGHPQQEKS